MRLVYLTRDRAGAFYAEHVNRPFFKPLVDFMSSGSVLPMVLARTAAITHWRALLGATDSRQAAANTLRGRHGSKTADIWRNVAHGSDSAASALREIQFFFPGLRMPGVR